MKEDNLPLTPEPSQPRQGATPVHRSGGCKLEEASVSIAGRLLLFTTIVCMLSLTMEELNRTYSAQLALGDSEKLGKEVFNLLACRE